MTARYAMGLLRHVLRRVTTAAAPVAARRGLTTQAGVRGGGFVRPRDGSTGFAPLASSRMSRDAFFGASHMSLQRRGFHVDPSDKDAWEKFILGLPATLKEDIAYRKKLFFEADTGEGRRHTLTTGRGKYVSLTLASTHRVSRESASLPGRT